MNNINTNNYSEKSNKSSRWNKLPYTLLLVSLLSLNNPTEAKTLDTYNFNQQNVEVLADSGIVTNIERRTWIILPKIYTDKIKNFVKNSKVVDGLGAEFTENFIVNQMKFDRWISKQNQLLFIWDAVYEQITKKNFYDWEDWDNNRLSEYENAMDSIESCWKKYKEWFTSYMKQQSAEARQQSAEARQESIRLTKIWLNQLAEFYNLFKNNSNSVKQEELKQMRNNAKKIIQSCKEFWINYKSIISPDMLKFYGIE